MVEVGQTCLGERRTTSYFWIAALLYIFFPKSVGGVVISDISVKVQTEFLVVVSVEFPHKSVYLPESTIKFSLSR